MNKKKQLRILVARIDRIGDVVLSTPIPREIKRVYPDSFVSVLARHYTKDIYLNNPPDFSYKWCGTDCSYFGHDTFLFAFARIVLYYDAIADCAPKAAPLTI